MIVNKKFLTLTLSTALAAALLTGCGSSNTASTGNTAEQTQPSAESGGTTDYSGKTINGIVTSVNNNEITLSIGGDPRGRGGERPDNAKGGKNFDGERPDGAKGSKNFDGERPDGAPDKEQQSENNTDSKNDNDASDSENTDSERPDGAPDKEQQSENNTDSKNDNDASDSENTDSKRPDGKKRENKTVTITIDDEAVLKDIKLSDITEGTRISITFNDNGNVSSISQVNDDFGPGNKGEKPDRNNKANDDSQNQTDKGTAM